MKKSNKQYRQGDVLVIPVDKIPDGLVKTKQVRLANGEVTGHHHSILDDTTIGYGATEDGLTEYFEVTEETELTHQEHAAIVHVPNKYRSVIQTEYTPSGLRSVQD